MDDEKTLTKEDLALLREICPGGVLVAPEELVVYATDASMLRGKPLAVLCPENVEQASRIMAWADERRMPVYPRGRGTNLVGDCVPFTPGVVISTTRLDRIIDISPKDFVAVVEPGVNTAVLQAACEAKGLYYPPDPATVKASSIGGNVVTCAGGMRALKYGVTRDFVLGMEVVLPGGDVVTFGGRTHKNVVGLDLFHLMAGSEGTLGFITKIFLKLLPRPEATASLMVGFPSCIEALEGVGALFGAGILPCACEYIGDGVLDLMVQNGPVPWPPAVRSVLVIRLDGSRATLPAELDRVTSVLGTAGIWMLRGEGEDEDALWEIRRRINPTAFTLAPDKLSDDATVPRGSLVQAVRTFEAIAKKHGARILHYGHVGDGNIHVNLMYDATDADDTARAKAALVEITQAVVDMGGSISGEHGIGVVKDIRMQVDDRVLGIMHDIKRVFDPHNIMNPGKAY